jgi:hypothetical protein
MRPDLLQAQKAVGAVVEPPPPPAPVKVEPVALKKDVEATVLVKDDADNLRFQEIMRKIGEIKLIDKPAVQPCFKFTIKRGADGKIESVTAIPTTLLGG